MNFSCLNTSDVCKYLMPNWYVAFKNSLFLFFPFLVLQSISHLLGCRRLTAPDAEMLYMQEVERMDGYGEESYPAKVSLARRPGGLQINLRSSERTAGRPRDTLPCRGGRYTESLET